MPNSSTICFVLLFYNIFIKLCVKVKHVWGYINFLFCIKLLFIFLVVLQVPMFTASGLRVRFLKVHLIMIHMFIVDSTGWYLSKASSLKLSVLNPKLSCHFLFSFSQVWEKSGYNTVEWVRYITKAGSYEIRC